MRCLFRNLILLLVLSACSPTPKERVLHFDGIENARELGGLVMQDGLGADRKTIVEDFSLSNVSYAPAVEALSARISQLGGGEKELAFIRAMVGVSVENFESTLDLIDARYGSLNAYLEKALGFSAEEQAALQSKFLF